MLQQKKVHSILLQSLILIVVISIINDNQMTVQCQNAYIKEMICVEPIKARYKHYVIIEMH